LGQVSSGMPVVQPSRPRPSGGGGGGNNAAAGFTPSQKRIAGFVLLLLGPSVLKKWFDKPAAEKVDLSSFNIVTHYDKPAIEKMDSTLRIEFCAS